MVQRRVPYVVEAVPADAAFHRDGASLFLVGTPSANRFLADLASTARLQPPAHPQGYALGVFDSPSKASAALPPSSAGSPAGVLHGVEDFNAHVLATLGGDTARRPPQRPRLNARRSPASSSPASPAAASGPGATSSTTTGASSTTWRASA